jgi:serine/threonine protein phosphatase 1
VHGRNDLLDELADTIQADLASAPREVITVFLGDYVDRGPQSAAVLDRLSVGRFPTPVIALRGNHEEMFLKCLEDSASLDEWRRYGGLETLHSYGVDVKAVMRGEGLEEARAALLAALPAAHLDFLRATQLSVIIGDYFFCHAGVRPGVALERQSADDLMWIRDGFLRFEGSFGKVVVHGHTPVADPDARANRINIDTGAFATSVLTCLVLEGVERRFLTAGARRGRGAR